MFKKISSVNHVSNHFTEVAKITNVITEANHFLKVFLELEAFEPSLDNSNDYIDLFVEYDDHDKVDDEYNYANHYEDYGHRQLKK